MEKRLRYPIGEQSFSFLRNDGYAYVDKTEYIYRLLNDDGKYYFFARPRRFGKSLFLSTLKCFFEGKRELFKGLFIDSTDWEWQHYPVLHLDLNTERYGTPEDIDNLMESHLSKWELKYGVKVKNTSHSVRFKDVIEAAHEKTGSQVVILVDEYDKPLVNNLNNDDDFEFFRKNSLPSIPISKVRPTTLNLY